MGRRERLMIPFAWPLPLDQNQTFHRHPLACHTYYHTTIQPYVTLLPLARDIGTYNLDARLLLQLSLSKLTQLQQQQQQRQQQQEYQRHPNKLNPHPWAQTEKGDADPDWQIRGAISELQSALTRDPSRKQQTSSIRSERASGSPWTSS